MSGPCRVDFRLMSGRCQVDVRSMLGRCWVNVGSMEEVYMMSKISKGGAVGEEEGLAQTEEEGMGAEDHSE